MATQDKLAIFDMDGTLVQTHLYSIVCNREALAEFGITDVRDEDIIASIGHPFRDFISVFKPDFPEEDIPKYAKILLERDVVHIPKLAKLFDGVKESIEKLRQDGWRTVICSNSDRRYLDLVDNTVHVSSLMDEIYTLDGRSCKTETLQYILNKYPAYHSIMVGDTPYDKQAADNCKIPFIGCLYGYAAEELKTIHTDKLVSSGFELYNAISQIQ